jgi:hypothetical protein
MQDNQEKESSTEEVKSKREYKRKYPGGGENFRTCPDRPWGQPSLYTRGTESLSWRQSGRGVALTTHPYLGPTLKKE